MRNENNEHLPGILNYTWNALRNFWNEQLIPGLIVKEREQRPTKFASREDNWTLTTIAFNSKETSKHVETFFKEGHAVWIPLGSTKTNLDRSWFHRARLRTRYYNEIPLNIIVSHNNYFCRSNHLIIAWDTMNFVIYYFQKLWYRSAI